MTSPAEQLDALAAERAALVDELVLERDSALARASVWRRLGDKAVSQFDVRAERFYGAAHDYRMRALVCQRRLDAIAGRGRWSMLADLRGPR